MKYLLSNVLEFGACLPPAISRRDLRLRPSVRPRVESDAAALRGGEGIRHFAMTAAAAAMCNAMPPRSLPRWVVAVLYI